MFFLMLKIQKSALIIMCNLCSSKKLIKNFFGYANFYFSIWGWVSTKKVGNLCPKQELQHTNTYSKKRQKERKKYKQINTQKNKLANKQANKEANNQANTRKMKYMKYMTC